MLFIGLQGLFKLEGCNRFQKHELSSCHCKAVVKEAKYQILGSARLT